jgi:hypothetical protein
MIVDCEDCGSPLTAEEHRYYSIRCEKCERAWHKRIEDWRHGRTIEPEFDMFFGAGRALRIQGRE